MKPSIVVSISWCALGLTLWWLAHALQIPSLVTQTTQFVRSIIVGDPTNPAVIIGGSGTQVLTINTQDQNGVRIEPGWLKNWSILRPDLGFDIVENPIDCPPWSWLLFRIDKDGNPDCRLVSSGDMDPNFEQVYQKRLQGPCPDNHYMVDVLIDGTVVCRALEHDWLYTQLTTAFQDRIDGQCPTGSFLIGVESNGTKKCLAVNDLLWKMWTCADWFVAQWFKKSDTDPLMLDLLCIPRKPQTQCLAGKTLVWFSSSWTPICSLMSVRECPAGKVYAWVNRWCVAIGSLISWACPDWQRLRGINTNGQVLCASNANACPSDHFANWFDAQGKLVCRPKYQWQAPADPCSSIKCWPVDITVDHICVDLAGTQVDDSKCSWPKPRQTITCQGTLPADSHYCQNTLTCGRSLSITKSWIWPHTIDVDFWPNAWTVCITADPFLELDTFTICWKTIGLADNYKRTFCCTNPWSIQVLWSSSTSKFSLSSTCNPSEQMIKDTECKREIGRRGIRDEKQNRCTYVECPEWQGRDPREGRCREMSVSDFGCPLEQLIKRCYTGCIRETDEWWCAEMWEVCYRQCP